MDNELILQSRLLWSQIAHLNKMIMQKFKPILFSSNMVEAILNGTKNQTRRQIKSSTGHFQVGIKNGDPYDVWEVDGDGFSLNKHINPKANIGDILWVRETFQHSKILNISPDDPNYGWVYRADGEPWKDYEGWTWKPSIFMPKSACRIFLQVTNVRIERLITISKKDAINEGIRNGAYAVNPIENFKKLWQSINGKDSWSDQVWVWVYDFKILEKPINFN